MCHIASDLAASPAEVVEVVLLWGDVCFPQVPKSWKCPPIGDASCFGGDTSPWNTADSATAPFNSMGCFCALCRVGGNSNGGEKTGY
ncbi:hypothetical protein SUGI_0416560 [Cryptomeria japonica]|nr:hypothetical protein SUGI_0416560 [Cryptomeria japonica]